MNLDNLNQFFGRKPEVEAKKFQPSNGPTSFRRESPTRQRRLEAHRRRRELAKWRRLRAARERGSKS